MKKKRKVLLISYLKFACEVLRTTRAILEIKIARPVCIQYKDDKGTIVHLSCDEDLIDACRCLRAVTTPRTCIARLSVRVHATSFQCVHVRTERTIVNEPAKRRCVSPKLRKQLHFKEQSTTAKTTKQRPPLQVFLQEKNKSSRQPNTTSMPIRSRSVGKGVHTDCWLCDISGEFPQACVSTLPYGESQYRRLNCGFGQCLSVECCNLLAGKQPDENSKMQISYVKSGT